MRKVVKIEEARADRLRRDAPDLSDPATIRREMSALYMALLDVGLNPTEEDRVRALAEARKVLEGLLNDARAENAGGEFDPAKSVSRIKELLG